VRGGKISATRLAQAKRCKLARERRFVPPAKNTVFFQYLFPVLISALALMATRYVFSIERGLAAPFFFAGVLASAYLGGRRGGVIATMSSVLLISWSVFPPAKEFAVGKGDDPIRLFGFVVFSILLTLGVQRYKESVEDERLLRALVETSPALLVLTETSGKILMFNEQCEKVTGYNKSEVLGRNLAEVFLPTEWASVVQRRYEEANEEDLLKAHENPWKTRTGELRDIEWRCRVLHRSYRSNLVLGVGTDITEQKRASKLLMEAELLASRSAIVNELAHELNNPLQSLTNIIELAEKSRSSGADGNGSRFIEYVPVLISQVERICDLSRRMLNETSAPAKTALRSEAASATDSRGDDPLGSRGS
jgi:PAS domain S-box-containing protein